MIQVVAGGRVESVQCCQCWEKNFRFGQENADYSVQCNVLNL